MQIWLNFNDWGVRRVILCMNLTYVPLTVVVVAVVVDGFLSENFGFRPPMQTRLVSALTH